MYSKDLVHSLFTKHTKYVHFSVKDECVSNVNDYSIITADSQLPVLLVRIYEDIIAPFLYRVDYNFGHIKYIGLV